jgi:hypothetical protein
MNFLKFKNKGNETNICGRRITVIVFSPFFSWLLAFPFEGQILYAITDCNDISACSFLLGAGFLQDLEVLFEFKKQDRFAEPIGAYMYNKNKKEAAYGGYI